MTEPCPMRHLHAPYITRAMKLRGLTLQPCPCGLQYAARPKPERN